MGEATVVTGEVIDRSRPRIYAGLWTLVLVALCLPSNPPALDLWHRHTLLLPLAVGALVLALLVLDGRRLGSLPRTLLFTYAAVVAVLVWIVLGALIHRGLAPPPSWSLVAADAVRMVFVVAGIEVLRRLDKPLERTFAVLVPLLTLIALGMVFRVAALGVSVRSYDSYASGRRVAIRRVFSGLGDPNFTSLVLVLGVGGALGLALTLRRRSLRFLAFLAAILLAVGVVRTVSLGGAIGLLALLVLLVLGARGLGRRVPKQLVPIVTGLCLVLVILGGGAYWVRLRSEVHRSLAASTEFGDYRLALLIGGARMAAAHPLFGVGPGRVASLMKRYEPARGSPPVPETCHNFLLGLGDESGLVPAAVVTAFLGALIMGLLRRWRARLRAGTPDPWGVVITATLLATLLQAMALPAQRSPFLWLAMVLAAAHLVSDPKPEEAAASPAA